MPYVRIWVHLVWGTKDHARILSDDLIGRLCEHISEYCREKKIYLDAIGGSKNHIHTLISLGSSHSIGAVANLIKGESSHWINQLNLDDSRFKWQTGYFAHSVSEIAIDEIRGYIANQGEHHKRQNLCPRSYLTKTVRR